MANVSIVGKQPLVVGRTPLPSFELLLLGGSALLRKQIRGLVTRWVLSAVLLASACGCTSATYGNEIHGVPVLTAASAFVSNPSNSPFGYCLYANVEMWEKYLLRQGIVQNNKPLTYATRDEMAQKYGLDKQRVDASWVQTYLPWAKARLFSSLQMSAMGQQIAASDEARAIMANLAGQNGSLPYPPSAQTIPGQPSIIDVRGYDFRIPDAKFNHSIIVVGMIARSGQSLPQSVDIIDPNFAPNYVHSPSYVASGSVPDSGYYSKVVDTLEYWVPWVTASPSVDVPSTFALGLFMSPADLAGRDVGFSDPGFVVTGSLAEGVSQ